MSRLERAQLAARLAWLDHRLAGRDRWSVGRLQEERDRELARLRAFAIERSRLYRQRDAGSATAPLDVLPVLTRDELLERYDDIVTDPRLRLRDLEAHVAARETRPHLGRYTAVATSGSSGRPAPFVFDAGEWLQVLASMGRGLGWTGLGAGVLHRRRVASVATTSPLHLSCQSSMTMPQGWLPSRRFDASQPIEAMASALSAWRPDLLVTYGSLLGRLADAQVAGTLAIAPRAIMVGADRLYVADRARAAAAWGPGIFERYATTEAVGIAAECEAHAGFHVFEDQVIVESLGADGRAVAPGTAGERVLVTVLWGRTLPLIRYELRDAVRLAEGPCPCGRPYPRIAELRGREEESLRLGAACGGGAGGTVVISAGTAEEVMDRQPVTAWQLVEEPDRLVLRLVGAEPDVAGRAAAELEAALRARGAAATVVPQHVAALDRGRTGKAPLLVPRRTAPSA